MVRLALSVGVTCVTSISFAFYALYAKQPKMFYQFAAYFGLSLLAYLACDKMIPIIKRYTLKADMFGMDINKRGIEGGDLKIPESLGIVCGAVFLLFGMVGVAWIKHFEGGNLLVEHVSGLLSICFSILLGFADDVMDIPWRYKMILPTFASIPLLTIYTGLTQIVVPIILRPYLGNNIDLGFLYLVYLGMLAIFCTNAINIYAGLNGLEVGQSIIIGAAVLLHNAIEIYIQKDQKIITAHIFSLIMILPFIMTSLALFKYNKFPSQVFVGDTYCYFAGMTLAVTGIIGHFSKTLLLFFIPQVINFLLSVPQLIGIIHCPRHRLPKLNTETKKLEGVKMNLNLVNQFLIITGPMTEKDACQW
eukprot:CAMPEP_0176424710 /NCGR_PEP_ID=MMETSP0127-20121128/10985_1 /TAXON_ID=938130 /ORGANISM="Platyophrya macrostoma, Strain WH" /LENGTH=361 /DNA_ID=CAMNT_0017805791 /DNA_START=36 /DNA_END=1118 /DNA_ORIENTATION=-